ncbi:cellulase family glycosylhydrolase [Natronospora cellulosivora (SeqCode)]
MKRKFLLVLMFCVFILLFTTITSLAANDEDLSWLTVVDGTRIVNQEGHEVWLTGTNWFGFNTGSNMYDGLWGANMEEAIKGMANRGINLLRVPVSTEIVYSWSQGIYPEPSSLNDFVNPELDGLNSFEIFDKSVQLLNKYGMKMMPTIHSPTSHAMGHLYPLWYEDEFTTEVWISSLEWLVEQYRYDDTIIAIDINNEPHGSPMDDLFAKWDGSTDENNWKYAAERCGERLLAINPNLLIVVEGVYAYPREGYDYTAVDVWGEESFYHWTWWGGNLRGVKDYPVDLGQHQSQLVYSPHDYGPLVHDQPWFYDGFNEETLYDDVWRDNWFYIMEDNIAPLLIGEWGGFMDGGRNEKWMAHLRDFIVEHRIHHTFWCYNANSGDTGGLVMHDFITWEEDKYELLKPALWQDDQGRFVGLDRHTPLGENGSNVTEYYGGEIGNGDNGNNGDNGDNGDTLVKGDLNNDGKIDSLDYNLMSQYVLSRIDTFPVDDDLAVGDLNGDSVINTLDQVLLGRYILGEISEF